MSVSLDNIRTICILGWGLKGDLFIRVPVIEAVKKRFPEARITVVVDPNNMDVLDNHPDVSDVFAFSRKKKPLASYLAGSIANIRKLRRRHFDLSINLYSGGSSPLIMRLVNARVRLGFDHSKALRKSNNLLAHHPSFCQHWTRAFAHVLQPLGVDPLGVRLGTSYYCREESRAKAVELLAPYGDTRLLAINLGAGGEEKRWPVERFVALAALAHDEYAMMPVVLTNPGMEFLSDQFMAGYQGHGNALHLPRLPLDIEAAVMERCDVVLTGDTALMHIASGLKRPVLALFTDTRPEAVEPEDCPFVACYVETADKDECGRPKVSRQLPVDVVAEGLRRLMQGVTA